MKVKEEEEIKKRRKRKKFKIPFYLAATRQFIPKRKECEE